MGHKKLIRFEAINNFENVLQYPENMAGQWHNFFNNQQPITLELACGKGEYTIGMAKMYPNRNFIGIDIKGNRIWRGAKTAIDEGLKNVAFLRTEIDKITNYFNPQEVAEIWITFPDPQLRVSKAKKRLTHPKFLSLYQQIIQPTATINLKTDSPNLFHFTQSVIQLNQLNCLQAFNNLYQQPNLAPELHIKTYYESLNIAKSSTVHYIQFLLNQSLNPAATEQLKQIALEQASTYPR